MYAHYMQKSSTDCGIASLRTILEQLEIKLKNTGELYKNYTIKKDQGLSLGELGDILGNYGVLTKAYEVENFSALKQVEQLPMVLVVENDGCAHYIVVHEIRDNQFIVSNPSEPEIMFYDEKSIQSIFLGYALCIDSINSERPIIKQIKKDKELTTGEAIYREVLPFHTVGRNIRYKVFNEELENSEKRGIKIFLIWN